MSSPRFRPLLPLLILFAAAPCAFAATATATVTSTINPANPAKDHWPRWRGPTADGHVGPDVKIPATLPAEPRHAWRRKIGFGLGSPVVAAGRVYLLENVADKETLSVFDAATGAPIWSVPVDDTFKDNQSAPGPRSTPLVDADRVYVVSCRGELRCLATKDGQTLWRTSFVTDFGATFAGEKGTAQGASRHGNNGSPWIDGDHLYVAVGGQPGAGIVCFEKLTGKVRWKSQDDVAGYGGPVVASPAGIKQVITFTTAGTVGLRPDDGSLLWRIPAKTSFGRHVASPVVVDNTVVIGSHQIGLIGIKLTQHARAVTAETAYTEKRLAINFSSPVVVAGHLYGLAPGGMMFCADPVSGAEKWQHEIPVRGNEAHAGFLVMGKNILALTDTGDLLLVAADPKAFRQVSRVKVAGDNWCNPAYAAGRLHLRDKEELLALDLLR